jgi:hypothetical protein
MKHSRNFIAAVFVVFVILTLAVGSAFAAKKPNIVLFLSRQTGEIRPGGGHRLHGQ